MFIHKHEPFFRKESIEKIEQHYKAKYIFDSPIRTKDGRWSNRQFAIFYCQEAHPEGSNYFAMGYDESTRLTKSKSLIITDGISATEDFLGVEFNGQVYYSSTTHDFREYPNGVFVDGGRDYIRYGGTNLSKCKVVTISVVKDKLEVLKWKNFSAFL